MKLVIDNESIKISLPYEPSLHYGKKNLSYNEIECVIEGYIWPALKTRTNEIFIFEYSEEDKANLSKYAKDKNIPIEEYYDVWSDILEPFLDTEYTESTREIINNRLNKCGLDKSIIKQIRTEIQELIEDYNKNSGLWDWINLNMNDLLDACIGKINKNTKMTKAYFEEYYWFVMSIQEKGRRRTIAST